MISTRVFIYFVPTFQTIHKVLRKSISFMDYYQTANGSVVENPAVLHPILKLSSPSEQDAHNDFRRCPLIAENVVQSSVQMNISSVRPD